MASLGEGDLIVESTKIGLFRVENAFASRAVYPRLGFTVGWELTDFPAGTTGRRSTNVSFEMTDLTGELLLSEHGPCVGPVYWAGPRRFVRSTVRPAKGQILLVADLSPWTLNRIEDHRGGGAPSFWIQLWPTLVASEPYLAPEVRGFRIDIPRDAWLLCLSEMRPVRYEILEVWMPSFAPAFEGAIGHVREARRKVDLGDLAGAMASSRLALEALHSASTGLAGSPASEHPPTRGVDERVRKPYLNMASQLRSLASLALHDPPVDYARDEVLFVVRSIENMLALASTQANRDASEVRS